MPGQTIKLKVQSAHFMRELGKRGNLLQLTAAETLNESAEEFGENYIKRLKRRQTVRNKFTLNSVKTFKATGVRRSGEPRQLHKINAIVGIRKMKGGRKHYLAKLEEGTVQRGNSLTNNRVPVPLNTARTALKHNKPISGPNRLTTSNTQDLQISGSPIGRNDGLTARQRWAILYGQKRTGFDRMTGDPKKPFFWTGNDGDLGIYKMVRNKFRKIRNLDQNTVKTRKRPNFKETFKQMKPARIQQKFVRNARKRIK